MPKTSIEYRYHQGFTLIELMIVIALIALIAVLALPSISSYFQVSLSTASRQIATTIKEAYNASMVTGKVYRLVYDLKTAEYWVESGPSTVLLDTAESKRRDEDRKKFAKTSEPAPSAFALDTTITRKKQPLPRGVAYEDIITQQSPDPITDGMAYTHFFPQGITEQTLIHLRDTSDHFSSLVISPLVGHTDLYGRHISKEDAFGGK